ncbi:MAG TPA: zinc-binding alcohol dehydrogenase family protein [Candidatus Dormibacteraeota bacterium]|nr:zinc-binding alcohol dehydrogenase family protein [Candidatus Dormibacteraeota bacterium]
MKALILKKPGEASVESVPEPAADCEKVLLRIRMIGLCGSDLNSFLGKNPLVTFPRIPGHEVAATLMEGIKGKPALSAGRNVTLSPYTSCGRCPSCLRSRPNACQFNETLGVQRDGAMTEYISVPADKLYPGDLTIKELCLVEPLTVGFHAVARGRVSRADTVAVFGCGGVGLGAIAACGFRGAKTIGIDLDDKKLRIAKMAGATAIINTAKESLHDSLRDLTGGRGPDVVIEAIGLPQTFRAAVEEVAFTGRVVYIGYAKEPVAYETRLFVQKELDILGSRNALPEDFRQVMRMLEEHRFPVDAAVSSTVSLDKVPDILRAWSSNPARFTKIMVSLD